MKPSLVTRLGRGVVRTSGPIAAWCLAALAGTGAVVGGEAAVTTRRPAKVDHAVTPAGGHHCGRCNDCDPSGCRLHRGHAAACRDGLCAPHCPVRPSQYGFYGTQWRRWPTQGVVPVGADEAVTPSRPPASQVPSAEEESPPLADDDPTAPPVESAPVGDSPRAAGVEPLTPNPDDAPSASEPFPDDTFKAPEPDENQRLDPASDLRRPASEPTTKPDGGEQPSGLFDQSSVPAAEDDEPAEASGMRYPDAVGRSVAAGAVPWRLQAPTRQRVASARGL